MGHTFTPKYRIEIQSNRNPSWSVFCAWCGKGKPTNKTLADVVRRFNLSFQPGGVNASVDDVIFAARVINQRTEETAVAVWPA